MYEATRRLVQLLAVRCAFWEQATPRITLKTFRRELREHLASCISTFRSVTNFKSSIFKTLCDFNRGRHSSDKLQADRTPRLHHRNKPQPTFSRWTGRSCTVRAAGVKLTLHSLNPAEQKELSSRMERKQMKEFMTVSKYIETRTSR